jgi:D-alanyl-D-alanine carboxypeptidase/D-alanyl-D-alanine-endopeptidase (penicillin-binding protein 4)
LIGLLGAALAACGLSAMAAPAAGTPAASTATATATAPAPAPALTDSVLAALTPPLPTLPLPQALRDGLQAAGIPASSVSLLVLPLGGGGGNRVMPAAVNGAEAPLISHLADQSRPVASVMKLFTTGAALLARGPASTWHTDTGLQGQLDAQGHLHGNLLLRGSGDPALVVEQVTQMMVRWRAAGLRHIDGDLVLDRSGFELPTHDPAAFDGESLKPYNAGPDALMLNQQAVTLRLAPSAVQPGQWQLSLEPELAGVTVVNQLKVGTPRGGNGSKLGADCSGDWREALQLGVAPRAGAAPEHGLRPWQLQVSGSLPLSCGNKDWPLLWQGDGAGDHAARVLLASWQALGGTLSGQVRQAKWPAELPVWQSWTSPPLTQVVRDINKFSNNVMARQLLLSLPVDPAASALVGVNLSQARDALQGQVAQLTRDGQGRSPCAAPAWRVDNGSGLSRDERSSAACLGRWVQAMWASPVMPEWLASLPLVGVDGTTRRWTGPAAGKAHIKTGSLDGVATMAGVVDGASGQRWAVVALGQHPQGSALRAWYAQVLGWLAQQ